MFNFFVLETTFSIYSILIAFYCVLYKCTNFMLYLHNSFFQVTVDRPATTDNILVSGPGINPKYCRANTPISFNVDATKSAKGNLDVKMSTDKGKMIMIEYQVIM